MKIVVLIENTRPDESAELTAEFGLSLYVERDGRRILFDTGTTGAFADNAEKLGVDLEAVDAVVVSHHHFDHGGGLARFLAINHTAKVYLRRSAERDFYFRAPLLGERYVGLDQRLLPPRHPQHAVHGDAEVREHAPSRRPSAVFT